MGDVSMRTRTRSDLPTLPWPMGALVGVLSIGAAVASGQFMAGFIGTDSSPYLAVGDAFVNATPGWLKEFAVSNFGTNDKLVLLSSMGVVLVILGALAGVVSRRNAIPGTVFAVVLGVIAVVAVLGRSDLGQLGVLAPVVSLVVDTTVSGTFIPLTPIPAAYEWRVRAFNTLSTTPYSSPWAITIN